MHGIGWLCPWQLRSASAAQAELALVVEASAAWPWRFSCTQKFSLDARALAVEMTLTNEDSAAMPAGMGHHPYFPHHPGMVWTSPAEAMWVGDAEVMPVRLEATTSVASP